MAGRNRRRRSWLIVGILGFLCLDAALIVLALSPQRVNQFSTEPSRPIPSPSPTTSVQSTPSELPSAQPTAAAVAPPSLGADFRMLGVTTNGIGFRSTKGSCSASTSLIERTTDAGVTWKNVNPSDLDVRETDGLTVVDESHVDLLAKVGDGCTLSAVSTYTQGEFWQAYPNRTTSINTAPLPTESPLSGVYAVAESDNSVVVVRFGDASCGGMLVESVPSISSSNPTYLGCLDQVTKPTPIAAAIDGSTLWIWANDSIYTSTDRGSSWQTAP
jgi:hypothetical protein